jgi:putative hydrolase of the HAD superfamily
VALGRVKRAVLLDAHGTLLELEPPAPLLQRILAERHGIVVELGDARRALIAEIAYYRAHMQEGTDPSAVAALRARCAEELRQALTPAVPGVARLSSAEMTNALRGALVFRPFPEVKPVLAQIRAAGTRTVVVSNWDSSLEDVLVELGLRAELDAVVSSGACHVAKPAPAIFAEALRRAGAEPEQAVHVGDSLEEDVAGARAAGIEPVLLVRGGADGARDWQRRVPNEVRTIRSLSELLPLISEPAQPPKLDADVDRFN